MIQWFDSQPVDGSWNVIAQPMPGMVATARKSASQVSYLPKEDSMALRSFEPAGGSAWAPPVRFSK